jgi:hypothetical protein
MKRLHRPRSTTYNQPAGKEEIAILHARIQREIALAQEDGDSKTFFNKLTRLSLSVLGYDESAIESFINNLSTQVTKPRAKINGLLEEKQTAILVSDKEEEERGDRKED